MLKHRLVIIMSIAMSSVVLARAKVDFVITDFGNTPCDGITGCIFNPVSGPFQGGETILVHVMVTSDTSFLVRAVQIDSRASSPELGLGGDIDSVLQPLDGIPNFWFDYSPIIIAGILPQGTYPAIGIGAFGSTTGSYSDFSNLQAGIPLIDWVAATSWSQPSATPGMFEIEAGIPYRLGGMVVTLPVDCGNYTLDVLNLPNVNDPNIGMVLDFGFGTDENDLVTKWASAT